MVVLPAPEGPTIEVTVPGWSLRLRPLSCMCACKHPRLPHQCFEQSIIITHQCIYPNKNARTHAPEHGDVRPHGVGKVQVLELHLATVV